MRAGVPLGAVIAAGLIAAALTAGCGSSSRSAGVRLVGSATMTLGSASPATTSTRTPAPTAPSPLAFARCMRAHGVPDYPDPSRQGQIPRPYATEPAPSGGFTANPNAPAYRTASNDCKSLADATPVSQTMQHQVEDAQLKFAVCMRGHGVPNYPDPSATGEIGDNGAISGVDPNSPAVQSAERECSAFVPRPPALVFR
jgi:hypothetical protein